jgi:hypothetical protein
MEQPKVKRQRGFFLLSPEKRKEIASMGGKAAHKHGTAHQWNSKEAAIAGQIGGKASKRKKKQHD